MIYFSDFGTGVVSVPEPNYYRTTILADATGQVDGTGYTTEESRYARTLTYVGNATIASEKFEFDGAGDSITLATSLLFVPGSKFTMEVFGLEFDAVNTGTVQGVANQWNAVAGGRSWIIVESAGSLFFQWSTDGDNTTNSITIGTVTTATPYDVAICWDGTIVYALLDGVPSVDTEAFTGSFFYGATGVRLGCTATSGTNDRFLDGRFTAFVYTRGEVLYASAGTHTVPGLPRTLDSPTLTDANWADVIALVGYDDGISRIRDFGPLDLPLTAFGNAVGSTGVTLGDGTPSIALDGTGDYVSFPDDAYLEFGSGDFTVEAFCNFTVDDATVYMLGKYLATGSKRGVGWGYIGADATPPLRAALSPTGTGNTLIDRAYTPATGSFLHLAFCLSGDDARHFAAGVQQGTTGTYASAIFNQDISWKIGSLDGAGTYFNGYLTQIRITKAARYTGNFTAPTGALPVG